VAAFGDGEAFLSSDITALIPYIRRVTLIGEDEVVAGTRQGLVITSLDGTPVTPRTIDVDWNVEQAQKGGYPHFMLKEMSEQPEAVENALRGRVDAQGEVSLVGLLDAVSIPDLDEVRVIGMGSAWIAGSTRPPPSSSWRGCAPAWKTPASSATATPSSTSAAWSSPSPNPARRLTPWRRSARPSAAALGSWRDQCGRSALSQEADAVLFMQSGRRSACSPPRR